MSGQAPIVMTAGSLLDTTDSLANIATNQADDLAASVDGRDIYPNSVTAHQVSAVDGSFSGLLRAADLLLDGLTVSGDTNLAGVYATGDIDSDGTITGAGLASTGDIGADGDISAAGDISATGSISATVDISAGGTVSATGDISATGNLSGANFEAALTNYSPVFSGSGGMTISAQSGRTGRYTKVGPWVICEQIGTVTFDGTPNVGFYWQLPLNIATATYFGAVVTGTEGGDRKFFFAEGDYNYTDYVLVSKLDLSNFAISTQYQVRATFIYRYA